MATGEGTMPYVRTVRDGAVRGPVNGIKPRLSEQAEEKYGPIDRASALCYTEAEEITRSLYELAKEIDDTGQKP